MDSARFDAMTRGLARTLSRRGALIGLTALTGERLLPLAGVEAKKKKKCLRAKQACQTKKAKKKCCTGLTCQALKNPGCQDGTRCRAGLGGKCTGFCGCRNGFECSEREGKTCQQCVFAGVACPNGNNDCCLLSTSCGAVTKQKCNSTGNVCCTNQGEDCLFDCECCSGMGCSERTRTCEDCAFLSETCNADDDCCLINSTCTTVTKAECGLNGNVCCQGAGKGCDGTCDCCGALVCDQNQCVNP